MCQRPLDVLKSWQKEDKFKVWREMTLKYQLEPGKPHARMGRECKAWLVALTDGASSAF